VDNSYAFGRKAELDMTINRCFPRTLGFVIAMTVTVMGSNPARAQWGVGYGLGWGFPGMYQAPSPTNLLNQHALTRAAAGRAPRPSHSPYRNNPNSYINRVRDNGFVPHSDVRSRQPPAYQPRPTTSLGSAGRVEPGATAATAAPMPVLPLSSFFDPSQNLIWPTDSPNIGDLKEKRSLSDQAILAVLEETRKQTSASITSVTDARQKLLDYGRPALRELRETSTPRIADTFHLFLLSLYESLAQAGSPPEVTANPTANP
jgi:hypothetical protein